MQRKIFLLFVTFFIISLPKIVRASEDNKITVLVDNKKISFSDAYPVNLNGNILIPLKNVTDVVDAKVVWKDMGSVKTATVFYGNKEIIFQMDSNTVKVLEDNRITTIKSNYAPKIINNRTMIPLRAFSDSLGADISWNGKDNTVLLNFFKMPEKGFPIEINNKNFYLGMQKKDVDNIFGNPKRETAIDDSVVLATYYENNYENLLVVGFEKGRASYVHSNAKDFKVDTSQIDEKYYFGYVGEDEVDKPDNFYFLENTSTILKVMLKDSETAIREIEMQNFDLSNSLRVKRGLDTLVWNEQLAKAARSHSIDMAKRNFFDHINLDGENPAKRISDAGYKNYEAVAENITAGNDTAIGAYKAWLHSKGHRTTMLSDLKYLGVGFCNLPNSTYKSYMTQNFAK